MTSGYAHVTDKSHGCTVWSGCHLPQNRDLFAGAYGNGHLKLFK